MSKPTGNNTMRSPGKTKSEGRRAVPDSEFVMNAVIRNQFYRDGAHTLFKIIFFEGVVLVVLVLAFVMFVSLYRPADTYFSVSEKDMQQLTQLSDPKTVAVGTYMPPMGVPNLSRPALVSWAALAASETMTMGVNNYRRRLQEASRHFTWRGWESFTKEIENRDLINTIVQNRQILYATPRSAPTIIAEGYSRSGDYEWTIEVPLLVTFELGQKKESRPQDVQLVIRYTPDSNNPQGIGIERWETY